MPERQKIPNPDSVSLEDIQKMKVQEFRIWSFLRLNSIDGHLKRHDKHLGKIEGMMWGLALLIIATLLAAIFA